MMVAENMMDPTYTTNGSVETLSYSFQRETTRASETTENSGLGNPFNQGTGLIRSFFRPSDDSTIFMGLIPSNMMFSRYLSAASEIMSAIGGQATLAQRMSTMAANLKTAITNHGIVNTSMGKIYPYVLLGLRTPDRVALLS